MEVEVVSVDDTSSEHDGAQSDDVVCLDINPQVQEDGAEFLINTTYIADM